MCIKGFKQADYAGFCPKWVRGSLCWSRWPGLRLGSMLCRICRTRVNHPIQTVVKWAWFRGFYVKVGHLCLELITLSDQNSPGANHRFDQKRLQRVESWVCSFQGSLKDDCIIASPASLIMLEYVLKSLGIITSLFLQRGIQLFAHSELSTRKENKAI